MSNAKSSQDESEPRPPAEDAAAGPEVDRTLVGGRQGPQPAQVQAPAAARASAGDCLVIIHTREPALLSKRIVLDRSPTRAGRGADNEIVLDGDSVSRRHARFERRGAQWLVADDGSTNGTFHNDALIAGETPLRNGDRVKIGPTIFRFLSGGDIDALYHEEIYRMTIIDGLTQIHNKRYLHEALEREIARSHRHERDLAVLMFDIDQLERINEAHGQLAGDWVLKELARLVQSRTRRDEVLARYEGGRFCLVLSETTIDGAVFLAETLRQKVKSHRFVFREETIPVTVTAGVAALRKTDQDAHELIARAEQALDDGKRQGRNRVVSS